MESVVLSHNSEFAAIGLQNTCVQTSRKKAIKWKNKSITKRLFFAFFLCVKNNEVIITDIPKNNLQYQSCRENTDFSPVRHKAKYSFCLLSSTNNAVRADRFRAWLLTVLKNHNSNVTPAQATIPSAT